MNKFCRGKILTVLQRKKFNFKYFSYQLEYDLELDSKDWKKLAHEEIYKWPKEEQESSDTILFLSKLKK